MLMRCHSLKSDSETTKPRQCVLTTLTLVTSSNERFQTLLQLQHSPMRYPPYVLDFFGIVLSHLTCITHNKHLSALVQLAQRCRSAHKHCSHLAAESSQSSLSKVSRESLDSIIQKLPLDFLQAPDPGSCISSTWELSALLYTNTQRHSCVYTFSGPPGLSEA